MIGGYPARKHVSLSYWETRRSERDTLRRYNIYGPLHRIVVAGLEVVLYMLLQHWVIQTAALYVVLSGELQRTRGYLLALI